MFDLLKLRISHGTQYIKDLPSATVHPKFKGFPLLDEKRCAQDCRQCRDICPTQAIAGEKLIIDLGKCIFCGDCERQCPQQAIRFSNFYKTGSTDRHYLLVDPNKKPETYLKNAIRINRQIKSVFGRSLKLRQVSAGGCNGCEMELAACGNVNFDMGRYGIEFVASPRHADGLVITGPVSENMKSALFDAYASVPSPKLIIVAGSCAISGGVFAASPAVNRDFFIQKSIDLYIPGCPVHPLTVINTLLRFIQAVK